MLVLCLLSLPLSPQWATRFPHMTQWLQGEEVEPIVLIYPPGVWKEGLNHSLALRGERRMGEGGGLDQVEARDRAGAES